MASRDNSSLTDLQFHKFADLVMQKVGIHLHAGKKQLLHSRISKVLRAKQIPSYKEYYQMLINESGEELLLEFINAVSTNTTHFFRESKHFDFIKKSWAPQLANKTQIKIWCAASSSGEEPYSLAMAFRELFPHKPCKILATDIDTNVLRTAANAVYHYDNVIDRIPYPYLQKYFQRGTGNSKGYVKIKKQIRQMVSFKKLNLIEPFPFTSNFDLISLRNVMIYFKKETKEDIAGRMYHRLCPGGYFFIGHSESLNGISGGFEYICPAIYRRPMITVSS